MSSCVYIYFLIDFNPTGHVRLELILVSGRSKLILKIWLDI